MHAKRWFAALGVVALVAGCSGDDADQLQQDYDQLSAEVDALREQQDLRATRHEKSSVTIDTAEAILADPEAFGTETQIAAAIAELATEQAQLEDDVFGSIGYRDGYFQTLFAGETDAVIDIYDRWLSEDGSQGGSLWVWHGTNQVGNPFELIGISLFDFDDDGRIVHELVTYPYPDEYVIEAFEGAGTGAMTTADAPTAPERPFSFAADDLCTWFTTDELTAALAASFDWEGGVTDPTSTEGGCRWPITGGDENTMLLMLPADHGAEEAVAWSDNSQQNPGVTFGEVVTGHPALPDGAAYVVGGFGYLAFGMPGTDQWLQMMLALPVEDYLPGGGNDDRTFDFASRILFDLGWVDTGEEAD